MWRVLRLGAVGVALVLAIAVAVPFLVPLTSVIPQITTFASDKLHQPVSVEELSLHVLPTPRLVARGIRIGRRSEVKVGEVEIVPDLMSFVTGERAMRVIFVSDVDLHESAFAIPKKIAKGRRSGDAAPPVHVRRIVLMKVKLHDPKVQVPEFDADLRLEDDDSLKIARLASRDGTIELAFRPGDGGAADVALNAKNWTLPAGPPLVFESLAAQGRLKGSELDVPNVDAQIYGGTLRGSVRLGWGPMWRLAGKASVNGVDLVPVQKALGKPAKVSGRLKGDAVFSSSAPKAAQLGDALVLDGPLEVVGGAYQGVDLSKAGDITGSPAVGDVTTFEELKGKLELRGRNVKVSDLCVRSPKVVAAGNIEIAADQKLSGKLDVSVAKTGGIVGVPVSLGGTTADPSVRPTKGYIIGAVIGTVLLPGIGTTLGASAGGHIGGTSSACK